MDTNVVRYEGREVYFTNWSRRDFIASFHIRGTYYELPELKYLAELIRPGDVYMDIGCNVGNHTLFMLSHTEVGQVIAFDPNPLARDLFLQNIELNNFTDRVEFHEVGLGQEDTDTAGMRSGRKNLGGARIIGTGDIKVRRGDDVMDGRRVDFIKIDVEGMEVATIRGLMNTITTHRPVMFVECSEASARRVGRISRRLGYAIFATFRTGGEAVNLIVGPPERAKGEVGQVFPYDP